MMHKMCFIYLSSPKMLANGSIELVYIMDLFSHLISAGMIQSESTLPSLVTLEYSKRQTGIAHSHYHWMTVLNCQIHLIDWGCVCIRSQKQHDIFPSGKTTVNIQPINSQES